MKCKYYYKGMPLIQYCKENNFNYEKIVQRIQDARGKDEYKNIGMEEIIEQVLLVKGKHRYYYKGELLSRYCKENGLNLDYIRHKISFYRKQEEYMDYSDDQIIEMIISMKKSVRKKYYYKGKLLIDYCREKGLNGRSVKSLVDMALKKDKNKSLSEEEVIEIVISRYEKKKTYKYKGLDLKEYCKKNNIDYSVVIQNMQRLKKSKKGKSLLEEDLIELSLDSKQIRDKKSKYMYKGKSLNKYCIDHEISYSTIIKRIENLKSCDAYINYSEEQIVYFALLCNRSCTYHYHGLPLNVYCKENDIDYEALTQRIYFLKRTGKYNNDNYCELIDVALSDNYKTNKYSYQNLPLTTYCDMNGLDASLVKIKINALKSRAMYSNYTMEMLIGEIVKLEENKRRINNH